MVASVSMTDAKRDFLGVDVADVYTHKCAKQMSEGVLKNSNASIAIAVTGNAMPYQKIDDLKSAAQVGEVFISISCYNSNNKIITQTSSHNLCSDEYICKLWYDTIKTESALSKITSVKSNKMFQKYTDGINESIITSNLSNFIRNKTTEQAFINSNEFLKTQKPAIPTFIKKDSIPQQNQLNNILLKNSRNLVSECFSDCDNVKLKHPFVEKVEGGRNGHIKGKKKSSLKKINSKK